MLRLLNCNALRQVSGLVYVAAAADGDVVGEELEGDYFQDRQQEFGGLGDVDDVLDELLDLFVAFDGDGDDAAGAGGDLLYIAEGFFVLEDARGVVGSLWRCRPQGGSSRRS